mmetsp:Transcript_1102/g.4286  ORF Transcript_1102/g.4286 Transcript_1102/m.4286 type:complete len:344 (-) Transcript_1102:444-1475(-)
MSRLPLFALSFFARKESESVEGKRDEEPPDEETTHPPAPFRSSTTKKLACVDETRAAPIVKFFKPARSMAAPADAKPAPGLRNRHPTERSASGCVERRRRMNSRARDAASESRVRRNVTAVTIQPARLLVSPRKTFSDAAPSRVSSDEPSSARSPPRSMNGERRYPNASTETKSVSDSSAEDEVREVSISDAFFASSKSSPTFVSERTIFAVLRNPPHGDTSSTLSSTPAVSCPSAPAFMNAAPPAVPGTPTANSKPLQFFLLSDAPSALNGVPEPTRNRRVFLVLVFFFVFLAPDDASSSSSSHTASSSCTNSTLFTITTPSNPDAENSTFEPLPMTTLSTP